MSALTDPNAFGLDALVETQRGMTDAEALRFLQTGELPNLAQPPVEDVEPPEPDVLTPDEALRFLAGEQLTAAAGFFVPSSLHYDLPKSETFKFNPRQPRDSDGKWTDGPGGGPSVTVPSAPSGKKVVPAIIYKKHADGTVVAQRGDRRLRWDAGAKKFVAEEREGGGWVERDRLTKTAAYNEMKQGDWVEPGPDPAPQTPITPPQTPEPAPAVVEPTVENGPSTAQIAPGAQRDAVDWYRTFAHAKVNRQLRTGQKQQLIGGDTDQVIAGLDEAMNANKLDRDIAVWRGVNVSPGNLTPGTEFDDPAFVSTSLKRDQAEVFARMPLGADTVGERSPVLMRIHVPEGTRALNFGGTEGEGEVLLNRGLRYRVNGTVKSKDYTIVNVDVIDDSAGPTPSSTGNTSDAKAPSLSLPPESQQPQPAQVPKTSAEFDAQLARVVREIIEDRQAAAKPSVYVPPYVMISDIRKRFPGLSNDEFDELLIDITLGASQVWVIPETNQKMLTKEQREGALWKGGQWKHLVQVLPTHPVWKEEAGGITAAAAVHTGAMIALVPTDEDAARLALGAGGEEADELHVTLAYLGEAALLPDELRHALVELCSAWAEDLPTIVGDAFAVSMFNPPDLTAGGEPCVVLGVSGGQLANVHEVILNGTHGVFERFGVPLHEQHRPWVPHITLAYTDDADLTTLTDRTGPVTFDRIRLAFGDEVFDVPLGEYGDDENAYEPGEDDAESEDTMMEQSDGQEVER